MQLFECKAWLWVNAELYMSATADGFKATPHKARLTALYEIYLHISRHLAQKSLNKRQYACGISVQSDEKSDCVSFAQALCGIALKRD